MPKTLSPDVLALDEPTNHLDITAIQTLEEALSVLDCALILLSHDQRFQKALTEFQLED